MTWREPLRALGSLRDNPLLLRPWTTARVRSWGILAGCAGVALLGTAVPAGISLLVQEPSFPLKKAFEVGYGLGLTLHTFFLCLIAVTQIVGALSRERSQRTLPGLLLTPLSALEIAAGTWLGAGLPVLAATALVLPATLVAALGAGVPVLDWAGTWVLLLSSACFIQTLALWGALLNPKPEQTGAAVAGLFMLLWFVIGPAMAIFNLNRNAPPWYEGLLWLTPVPALHIVWGGSMRLTGSWAYLIGPLWCAAGTAFCLGAVSRKLHDPERPSWSRLSLLVLAAFLGLAAGLRPGSATGPRADGILALLLWGLPAALVAVPSRTAFRAWVWRDDGKRGPLDDRGRARRFLAMGLGILALVMGSLTWLLGSPGVGAADGKVLLAWAGASVVVMAFAEILSLTQLLFKRGIPMAFLIFLLLNVVPSLAVGFLTRWRQAEYWFAPWALFRNLSLADQLKALAAFTLCWGTFHAMARWHEGRTESSVRADRETLLSAPA